MEETQIRSGTVFRVNGPAVTAAGTAELSMGEQVLVGEMNLPGEIIRQEGDMSTIQMYEDIHLHLLRFQSLFHKVFRVFFPDLSY